MSTIDQGIFEVNNRCIGVKVLLYIDDTHAVFEQRDGKGTFPFQIDLVGGTREGNETPLETAHREVFEETEIQVDLTHLKHAAAFPSIQGDTYIEYFMAMKTSNVLETIRPSSEGLGLVILEPSVFVSLDNAVKFQQERVQNFLLSQFL